MIVENRTLREVEFLADLMHGDAAGVASGSVVHALDGLEVRLAAEDEGLMMDRQEEFETGVAGHSPRLFRGAVVVNPGIVGAYRHDGQIVRAVGFQAAKRISECGVAAEQDAMASGVDGVSVVAAMRVGAHASAPMIDAKRANGQRANGSALVPTQFLNAAVSADAEQVAGVGGGHDGGR